MQSIHIKTARLIRQFLQDGPFTKMAVSPNGKCLALFTTEGKLWVVSTDFRKNLSEFGTKSKIPPQQLVWLVSLVISIASLSNVLES
jgi:hypothetical protein